MERAILWVLFFIGIVLLFFSLRKPSIKDWILIFLLNAYLSAFIGHIVVKEKMLKYPVRFLSEYFDESIVYEYLLFPVVCIYFYQTTYHSRYISIVFQCVLYTAGLTIVEVVLEKYTDLIAYETWTWMHTFISTFIVMIVVRIAVDIINRLGKE